MKILKTKYALLTAIVFIIILIYKTDNNATEINQKDYTLNSLPVTGICCPQLNSTCVIDNTVKENNYYTTKTKCP
jgi:hypothetical protein